MAAKDLHILNKLITKIIAKQLGGEYISADIRVLIKNTKQKHQTKTP